MLKVDTAVRDLFTVLKPLIEDKKVLDLGCIQHELKNTGRDTWLHGFLKKYAKYVLGVDYLKKEVDILKKRGYNIIYANVQTMKLNEIFDVAVAGELIEHLENPGLFIQNVKSYLKPNGLFILTFPNPYALSKIKSCIFKLTADPPINPEHCCWFTPQSIKELLRRYNFKIIKAHLISKKGTIQYTLCKLLGGRFQGSFMVVAENETQ